MAFVATSVRVAMAAALVMTIGRAAAAQNPPAPAASSDPYVSPRVLVFAGTGLTSFNNSSNVTGDRISGATAAGAAVAFKFGGPVGVSVTLRGGGGGGPKFSPAFLPPQGARRTLESTFTSLRFFDVSIGAPVDIGPVLVEPMLDLTNWTITDRSTTVLNNVTSTTTVDESGNDPGFGMRFAVFPTRWLGAGYEFHYVQLKGAAPNLGAGGDVWLEELQSVFSVYVRWRR